MQTILKEPQAGAAAAVGRDSLQHGPSGDGSRAAGTARDLTGVFPAQMMRSRGAALLCVLVDLAAGAALPEAQGAQDDSDGSDSDSRVQRASADNASPASRGHAQSAVTERDLLSPVAFRRVNKYAWCCPSCVTLARWPSCLDE